jgi:multidrug efflux pump subunit AcrA (membrane-fusion protein)
LIGIMILALGMSACRGEFPASAASQEKPKPQAPAASPPAREVRIVPAAERALPRTVAATGTLAAEDQVTLSAKVAGRVESIDIDLGTRIRQGQPLARLDQTDFKLRVEHFERRQQIVFGIEAVIPAVADHLQQLGAGCGIDPRSCEAAPGVQRRERLPGGKRYAAQGEARILAPVFEAGAQQFGRGVLRSRDTARQNNDEHEESSVPSTHDGTHPGRFAKGMPA